MGEFGQVSGVRADGEEFPLEASISQIAVGGQHLYTVTLRDVTQQRRAREQLMLLETCVERLNDIVIITAAEPLAEPGPSIVFVNQAFERRTGYRADEVVGRSPRLLQGPRTQRPELDRIAAALRRRQIVRSELINYTKRGDEFWVELDIVPIVDSGGRLTHWVAVARDIGGRKLAEAALAESQGKYRAIIETSLDAVVQMNSAGLVTGWNERATSMFGWRAVEAIGAPLHELIIPARYREGHRQGMERFLAAAPGRSWTA
jgi:PAS domain S-box-containing protein